MFCCLFCVMLLSHYFKPCSFLVVADFVFFGVCNKFVCFYGFW